MKQKIKLIQYFRSTELISETQLRDLLEPSVRYLLGAVTERHPRYLIHIFNRFDEAYALVMLLVERHYLKTWGGSFTENFYGMKRERVLAVPNLPRASAAAPDVLREATKLGRKDMWKSLFMIVGVPYLKRKLDDAYEIHAGGAAANLFGSSYSQRDQLREGVCSPIFAHVPFSPRSSSPHLLTETLVEIGNNTREDKTLAQDNITKDIPHSQCNILPLHALLQPCIPLRQIPLSHTLPLPH